jgi:hypothetical protein
VNTAMNLRVRLLVASQEGLSSMELVELVHYSFVTLVYALLGHVHRFTLKIN